MRRTAAVALLLLGVSCAQDAVFTKSALVRIGGAEITRVDLIVSDIGVTVRTKTKPASVIIDLPYDVIKNLGYTLMDQRRTPLVPLLGAVALLTKGQSHWLMIESSPGVVNGTTVLRLDKTEYRGVVAALTAKSGKHVEMIVPNSTLVDPTIGSQDEYEVIPFPIDQVLAMLKVAMEQYSCKVGKTGVKHIECTRSSRPADAVGGGEGVTAALESRGQETRVQITTRKGFGKNWSQPIYLEMLRRLKSAH
jgi:hypothetical protein